MTALPERKLLLAASWLAASLFAYLVISGLPATPPDLAQFYFAGQLMAAGQPGALYDPAAYTPLVEQLEASGTPVSEFHFFNRPAFAAIPWAAAALLPYTAVAQLSLLLNGLGICLLAWKLPTWFPSLTSYRAWLICFPPFLWSLAIGQDTVWITLAVGYALALARQGREERAGLVLSLCVVKPHLIWLLPAALFFTGQRRTVYWFLGGAGCLAALSGLIVGVNGLTQWAELLRAGTTDYAPAAMATLRAIGVHTHPVVAAVLGIAVAGAFLATCRTGKGETALPAAIIASVILSPHAYVQDASVFAVAAGFAGPFVKAWILLPWPILAFLVASEAFPISYALAGLFAMLILTLPHLKRLPPAAEAARRAVSE